MKKFDVVKYNSLLEKLEAVEINFSSLENIIDYRIEAEYFDKRFLQNDFLLSKINTKQFFEIADYENGRAYSSDEFSIVGEGIRVSKIGDVTNKRPIDNWELVSEKEFENLTGRILSQDDILMTLTGDPPDVGKVIIINDITIPATWNQRVARVFLNKEQKNFISSKAFFAILSSKYCREQLERYAKGIRQRNLGIECVQKLVIPILSNGLQEKLGSLIEKSGLLINDSN